MGKQKIYCTLCGHEVDSPIALCHYPCMQQFWEIEFANIANMMDKKYKNLKRVIDIGSETYLFLFERFIKKGIELADKPQLDNIKCYIWLANKNILTLARDDTTRKKYEVYKAFDESLILSISDIDENPNNPMKEDMYDFGEPNEIQVKIDKLMASKHIENQQLGLLATCLLQFSTVKDKNGHLIKVPRKQVIESTLKVLGIKIARFYELERLLKEYLTQGVL